MSTAPDGSPVSWVPVEICMPVAGIRTIKENNFNYLKNGKYYRGRTVNA